MCLKGTVSSFTQTLAAVVFLLYCHVPAFRSQAPDIGYRMFLQSIFSFVFVLLTTIIIKTKANQDQLAHEKPTDFKCLWYKHPVIRILKIV